MAPKARTPWAGGWQVRRGPGLEGQEVSGPWRVLHWETWEELWDCVDAVKSGSRKRLGSSPPLGKTVSIATFLSAEWGCVPTFRGMEPWASHLREEEGPEPNRGSYQ